MFKYLLALSILSSTAFAVTKEERIEKARQRYETSIAKINASESKREKKKALKEKFKEQIKAIREKQKEALADISG